MRYNSANIFSHFTLLLILINKYIKYYYTVQKNMRKII